MAYPTSAEIRTQLEALKNANPFCSIVNLKKSLGGVDITALKISKVTEGKRVKVLFTGGIHANELAPPAAVLSCVTKLLDAYKNSTAITYGAFSLTPQDVKDIVEHVDIYAAPMINPDGYALQLSLLGTPQHDNLAGRKNGAATGPCVLPDQPGVNINRNFDILWNFQRLYAPGNNVASSSDPCHYNYTGILPGLAIGAPFSEPETENVKALLDEGIEFYVDVHSYGPTILHPWGIDTNQTSDPAMWFGNPAFDGKRDGTVALPPFAYREFIPAAELSEVVQLANHMAKAIKDGTDVAGRAAIPYQDYVVQQSAQFYPTSGSADDYAFSRHRQNPASPFVRAFTLECGVNHQPVAAQFAFVEQEVHCALLALLQSAAMWIGKQNPAKPLPSSGSGGCIPVFILGASGLAAAAAVLAQVLHG
jgi:carboxypeptidase T